MRSCSADISLSPDATTVPRAHASRGTVPRPTPNSMRPPVSTSASAKSSARRSGCHCGTTLNIWPKRSALRPGGGVHAEHDEVRQHLVALVLEVVLGQPHRVVAEAVGRLGPVQHVLVAGEHVGVAVPPGRRGDGRVAGIGHRHGPEEVRVDSHRRTVLPPAAAPGRPPGERRVPTPDGGPSRRWPRQHRPTAALMRAGGRRRRPAGPGRCRSATMTLAWPNWWPNGAAGGDVVTAGGQPVDPRVRRACRPRRPPGRHGDDHVSKPARRRASTHRGLPMASAGDWPAWSSRASTCSRIWGWPSPPWVPSTAARRPSGSVTRSGRQRVGRPAPGAVLGRVAGDQWRSRGRGCGG